MTYFEFASMLASIIVQVFDKVDNYILGILERRPNLEKSSRKIAIMWSISNYKYGFYNSGTGYRKGWHLQRTYYAWDFLQFFSNETQMWYPYSSFWVLLLKGAANGMIILCCFALFILLVRIINIAGLIKRKKAAFVLMVGFHSFDLLCIIIAFFTSTNAPGTKNFEDELLDVVGALVVTILVWVAFFSYIKKRKVQSGDGKGK